MLTRDEMEDIHNALSALPDDDLVLSGILKVIRDQAAEADEFATHPDTPEEKRSVWCGWRRGLMDLLSDLADLRSGAYRSRPEMKAALTATAEATDMDDAD